nr:hypothetical protein [Mucilaginibacter sp. SP1R1]
MAINEHYKQFNPFTILNDLFINYFKLTAYK